MPAPHARTAIEQMAGYTPGEQPQPGERVIKLNTNENPYPPSPRVFAALGNIAPDALRRYPSPMADDFRRVAGSVHGLSPDHVLAGNGSDEILAIVLRTFCNAGDVLAAPDPTYSLYPVLAEIGDIRYQPVPWEDGWQLPVRGLLAHHPRAIFFANPNAPSGTVVPLDTIAHLAAQTDALVLVDEAYVDFASRHALPLLTRHENIVITRTLSKGYSLAGLRFGYALAAPGVIAQMTKVKDSYNCDAVSIAAACAALDDQVYAHQQWTLVRGERTRMTNALTERGWRVVPSEANFVLASLPPGRSARAVYEALKARAILVRYFDKPGLTDKLRITIGTRDENAALLAAIDAVAHTA